MLPTNVTKAVFIIKKLSISLETLYFLTGLQTVANAKFEQIDGHHHGKSRHGHGNNFFFSL